MGMDNTGNGSSDNIGTNLRKIRRAKRYSQQALAELAEVHQTQISKIERGHTDGSLSTLQRILAPLGFEMAIQRRSENENVHH
jgi:transcriptional regulator with XRE-family HTH domain